MNDPHAIRPKRPGWTRVLPYPGRMPSMTYHQWNVLGLLSVAGMFDAYDVGILGLAISDIQASLSIAEADVGRLMAVIRLGMLPAFALTIMADRLGRRRLLLVTIVGFTVCTFLIAFGAELFPTSYRSTAAGMRAIVGTLAGAVGLALEGPLYAWTGSHAAAITLMTPALLLAPLVIYLFLPETAARELEDLSPELDAAQPPQLATQPIV